MWSSVVHLHCWTTAHKQPSSVKGRIYNTKMTLFSSHLPSSEYLALTELWSSPLCTLTLSNCLFFTLSMSISLHVGRVVRLLGLRTYRRACIRARAKFESVARGTQDRRAVAVKLLLLSLKRWLLFNTSFFVLICVSLNSWVWKSQRSLQVLNAEFHSN